MLKAQSFDLRIVPKHLDLRSIHILKSSNPRYLEFLQRSPFQSLQTFNLNLRRFSLIFTDRRPQSMQVGKIGQENNSE